jgi:multidrug efflux pump subunit AcrA (membrane-fusion protein)
LEETLVSLQESLASKDMQLRDAGRLVRQREQERQEALRLLDQSRSELRAAQEERDRLRAVERVILMEKEQQEASRRAKLQEVRMYVLYSLYCSICVHVCMYAPTMYVPITCVRTYIGFVF